MYASCWFPAGIPKYTYLVYTTVLFVVKWRQNMIISLCLNVDVHITNINYVGYGVMSLYRQ